MPDPSTDLPRAPACARNRDPILAVLREAFAQARRVLEIGSGTGEHAVHFAAAMPWLDWQCTEVPGHLRGVSAWLGHAGLPNTPPAIALDVAGQAWPAGDYDAAFTANTLHIMGWPEVEACFAGLGRVLSPDATLVAYGPFNRDGAYSSDSNRDFDAWLKARDPRSGLRDREAVDALAAAQGFALEDDLAMPANNRCLVWRRRRQG